MRLAMFRMLVLQATIFRTSRRSIRCVTGCDSREFCSWRARIKRLLELDRSLGRKLRSKDAEQANFLFFSEEAPGTGADTLFSEYEAFALLNGLRIMGGLGAQLRSCNLAPRLPRSRKGARARILMQDPDDGLCRDAAFCRFTRRALYLEEFPTVDW